ncbi:MAG TPA: hypothetical protein VEB19_01075 [Gemmatimonadaceae bacterium]|nr:hypothetical protein [Gemmatimonadaceae bacterium]
MPATVVERRLAELKREVARALPRPLGGSQRARSGRRSKTRRWTWADVAVIGAKATVVVVLPLLVYVRAAVELYQRGVTPWLAVASAAFVAMGSVAAMALWYARGKGAPLRALTALRWVAIPTFAAWCLFALFRLSSTNTKTEGVRDYFSQVHPVLRVAIATAILADPAVIITDFGRSAADYTRMGLRVNDRTKHYRQPNGWVHAVDLRTIGRGEIRNRLLQAYFAVMGFQTLRHVGTADHLHVQLAVRE